jgi:DNA polymerase
MDIITLDFETYYDKDYSLSKITTEEYVRDPRFQVIGVGVKVNDGKTEWFSGTHGRIKEFMAQYNWANSAVLAHNMMFDGAIMSWRFDIRPKALFDTLCMARAIHGVEKSASLKALAENYAVGEKGTEVLDAKGKRRSDFTPEELSAYGGYCVNDVELTYDIFNIMMSRGFPKSELKLIDLTLRMFTEPTLGLDRERLEGHLTKTQLIKEDLLKSAGVEDKADLMSNPKFAALLGKFGAPCPMKISPTTGNMTFALAKSDQGMKDLLEHDDPHVQSLAAARLGVKSTLEETRTQRFIDISGRGMLPVPVRYYAAHTGRWGGTIRSTCRTYLVGGLTPRRLRSASWRQKGSASSRPTRHRSKRVCLRGWLGRTTWCRPLRLRATSTRRWPRRSTTWMRVT